MKKILLSIAAVALLCSCSQIKYDQKTDLQVIPQPLEAFAGEGSFCVKGATVSVDASLGQYASDRVKEFAAAISKASGAESQVTKSGQIAFTKDSSLEPEAYTITVTPKKIKVAASDLNGTIYAIQTLRQLLPEAVFSGADASASDWNIACIKVKDAPRFGYRGMHLDVSRHFFSTDEVKKYIDALVMHKMNRLHWHLTDDQGWRVPIDAFPKLTEVGSIRKETVIGKNSGKYDGTPYGGFYTKEEIKDIIAYAEQRGIVIVPEIDMPGHMLAALAAYPELGCEGGPYDVWGQWGISDDVLCLGKESTYTFLEKVFDEICELFPSEYIHIGGDECPKVKWETCPDCQAKIAQLDIPADAKFAPEYYLQSYVTKRMEEYLAQKGRKVIGWDEILEGEISPNAAVMSWRGVSGGEEAVKLGHKVVMTPHTHVYFDYYQTNNPTEREPFGIGGFLPVEQVYSFEPFSEEMTSEQRALIMGVQANLWSEYIPTDEHLEHMLLPRMCALSEVQWCLPENKDYDRFLGNMSHMFNVLDEAGYSYAPYLKEDGLVK